MLTITIRANQSGGSSRETFSERVGAAHLRDKHYTAQLIERLIWATTDAESLELASNRAANTDESDRRGVGDRFKSCEGLWRGASSRQLPWPASMSTKRPVPVRAALKHNRSLAPLRRDPTPADDEDDRSAADWLYHWSHEQLRPCGEALAARITRPTVALPTRRRNPAR